MDKDQVLRVVSDLLDVEATYGGDTSCKEAAEAINSIYAELESLRAMRKRVEAKVEGWEKNGTEDAKFCASQIRAALGDSYE